MPTHFPTPLIHFTVKRSDIRLGFSEATGITQGNQAIEYRDGFFPKNSSIKTPGLRKSNKITLKRCVVKSGDDFFKWISNVRLNRVERRDVIINLLDETHAPAMTWKVHNAFPFNIEGEQFNAKGNEVAMESIELAHEGLELEDD